MDTTTAPTSYAPATTAAPSYGQKGDAVSALQTQYNTQNAGREGFVPLKVDGYYGPLTAQALGQQNNTVQTSAASRTAAANSSTALSNALGMYGIADPSNQQPQDASRAAVGQNADGTTSVTGADPADPYIASLNGIAASSNASTKNLISTIIAAKTRNQNSADTQFDAYKKGLQLMGIQSGAAQSSPDLLAGHIQEAENQHQQKLQDIESNTAKALVTAQQAQENNDFRTLNSQMAYVKQLNAEKAAELKAYNTTVTAQPKLAAGVAHNVYQTMQTLDPADQEQFLQAVATQYKLPLGTLVTALSDEHLKTQAATDKATAATAKADQAGLLSPGEAKTLGVKYGTTKAEAAKMGIVPVTAKKGGASSTAQKKAQIAAGEQFFSKSKGTDGFVDPYDYQKAYSDWTAKGNSTKDFVTAFPPKDYVNPKATNLPSYLMPAKSKTATSSGRKS